MLGSKSSSPSLLLLWLSAGMGGVGLATLRFFGGRDGSTTPCPGRGRGRRENAGATATSTCSEEQQPQPQHMRKQRVTHVLQWEHLTP